MELLKEWLGEHEGPLGEVAGAAHVVVRGGGGRCGRGRRRRDDQRAYGTVAVSLQGKRPLASLLESHGTEVMRETQDPERGAQRLIRMGTSVHLLAQQRCGCRPHALGAFQKPLVVELNDGPMSLGAVFGLGAEAPRAACPQVPGDRLTAIIDLDRVGADAQINALTDQPIGNRVVLALELDVIIEKDLGTLPGRVLVPMHGQCPKCGTVSRKRLRRVPASRDKGRSL